jgi:hypothetical protein
LKKLEKAKIAPPPDWLEDQVRPQQMLCDLRVAITLTSEIIHPPALPSVFFLQPEKEHSV